MFKVELHISPMIERLLLGQQGELIAALRTMEKRIMAKFDELRDAMRDYIKAVEDSNRDVDAAIQKAIEKDDADEEVDFSALLEEVKAARDKIPPAPTVPETPPTA